MIRINLLFKVPINKTKKKEKTEVFNADPIVRLI